MDPCFYFYALDSQEQVCSSQGTRMSVFNGQYRLHSESHFTSKEWEHPVSTSPSREMELLLSNGTNLMAIKWFLTVTLSCIYQGVNLRFLRNVVGHLDLFYQLQSQIFFYIFNRVVFKVGFKLLKCEFLIGVFCTFIYLFIYLFIYFVVQVQLSSFPPPGPPAPPIPSFHPWTHPCWLCPWVLYMCSLTALPLLSLSPLPSCYCEVVLYFSVSDYILLACFLKNGLFY